VVRCHDHLAQEIILLEHQVHHVLDKDQVALRNDLVLLRKDLVLLRNDLVALRNDLVALRNDRVNVPAVQEWLVHDQVQCVQVLQRDQINDHKVIVHFVMVNNMADNVLVARHLHIVHKVHHRVEDQVVVVLAVKAENHNNVVAQVAHLENRMAKNERI
jgi:hypothetical protein